LMEKQKIKHYYGIGERQLRRYFGKATAQKGNTGENLLLLCENRLDNVIRRVGLCKTRPQARQGVAHGHFRVNGVKVDKPSLPRQRRQSRQAIISGSSWRRDQLASAEKPADPISRYP